MTTIEGLGMDANVGAMQTLDRAELAGVDGGLGPLASWVVIGVCGLLIGAAVAVILWKTGHL
jgi:lactobin A/cerein 7B family class IIb bacteriocin